MFQTDEGLFIKLFKGVEKDEIYFEATNPVYNPIKPMRVDEIKQVYAIEFELNKHTYKR